MRHLFLHRQPPTLWDGRTGWINSFQGLCYTKESVLHNITSDKSLIGADLAYRESYPLAWPWSNPRVFRDRVWQFSGGDDWLTNMSTLLCTPLGSIEATVCLSLFPFWQSDISDLIASLIPGEKWTENIRGCLFLLWRLQALLEQYYSYLRY